MTMSEDLFLLLTRDDGRPESSFAQVKYGYAAANITDLVLAERVTLSTDKDPRLTVVDASPTGHPALDAALARLQGKDGKKLSGLVTDARVAAEEEIVRSLAAAGVIGVEEKKMLGLVPEKHPVLDPAPERAVRQQLASVLAGATPTARDATLLSILQGLDIAAKVLAQESRGMNKKELKQRIRDVSEDVRAGEAVSHAVANAVAAMNTAIMTAAIIPVITSGSGS